MRSPAWFWVALCLLCSGCAPPSNSSPLPTGIAGRVQAPVGSSIEHTVVYAYRNADSGLRGPADFAAPVDEQGEYFLDLVEGRYFLVARRRSAPRQDEGPPRPGDVWARHPHNPLEVREGRVSKADFQLPRSAYREPVAALARSDTALRGRLLDESGRPLEGLVVLAYRSEEARGKPDHLSQATGPDGRFVLYLSQGGRYCLLVRDQGRGRPGTADLYRFAEESEPFCPSLSTGRERDLGTLTLRGRQ